ncbi:MAG: DNA-directed RNA polymerase subunit omega [Firmicutes bacterium]|nr:DNA-directed RNA polymerase subunit omega [Bacillota bacterium]
MLHPSYGELIETVNKVNEEKEIAPINSRYSIVMAAARRAREIVNGDQMMVPKTDEDRNVLSEAVEEMAKGKIAIRMTEDTVVAEKDLHYEDMAVVDFSRDMEEDE